MGGLIGLVLAILLFAFAIVYFFFRFELESCFSSILHYLGKIFTAIIGFLFGCVIGLVISLILKIATYGVLFWIIIIISGVAGGLIVFANTFRDEY